MRKPIDENLIKRELLRTQMVDAFHVFNNVHPIITHQRTHAWNEYCAAREAYLKETQGFHYVPLYQTITIPGPYSS